MSTYNANESAEKKNWFDRLMEPFDALMVKHDMPEDIHVELRNFVVELAKEQYKSGNKSGIAWLRKKAGAQRGQMLIAGPALTEVAPAT